MDVFSLSNYRDILRQELARRIKQNPRYSQGAFARDLDLTPGRLSEILHGKQGLSPKAAEAVAKALKLKDEEQNYFLDLISLAHGRSQVLRENARLRLHRYRKLPQITDLKDDIFQSISDWYHMAILEMAQCPARRVMPLASAKPLASVKTKPQTPWRDFSAWVF